MANNKLKMAFATLAGAIGILVLVLYQYAVINETGKTLLIQSSNSVSHNTSKQFGYVLPLGYGGQQAKGCAGILSLQCWLKSFNLPMMIVEPMIQHSQFVGNGNQELGVRAFSEIFSIDYFNNFTTGETGYAKLSKWEDFLQHSPKNVIYIMYRQVDSEDHKRMEIDWESKSSGQCNKNYSVLNFLKGFCVVKAITCNKHAPFTAKDMKNVIFNTWKPEEVTLVLTGWSPRFYVPNPMLPDPSRCKHADFKQGQSDSPFAPSEQVMEAVDKYRKLFLMPKTSVAVMIRSEHFIISLGGLTKSGKVNPSNLIQIVDKHLKCLVTQANKLADKFPGGTMFVTADVGAYGSGTWGRGFGALAKGDMHFDAHVENAIKETVASFHHKFRSFEEWEQSFTKATNGINDQTFIAALQRVIASRARCLLLFGGGSFELLAFQDYLHNHPNQSEWCWRWVDVRTDFMQRLGAQFHELGHLNISTTADLCTN